MIEPRRTPSPKLRSASLVSLVRLRIQVDRADDVIRASTKGFICRDIGGQRGADVGDGIEFVVGAIESHRITGNLQWSTHYIGAREDVLIAELGIADLDQLFDRLADLVGVGIQFRIRQRVAGRLDGNTANFVEYVLSLGEYGFARPQQRIGTLEIVDDLALEFERSLDTESANGCSRILTRSLDASTSTQLHLQF